MSTQKKAVVLLSGGLDSAVALWWAKAKGFDCSTLSFDYGQRHSKELRHAKILSKEAGVLQKIIRFTLPWGGSTLTDKSSRLPHHSMKEIMKHKIPSTYVPGRNTIFLSFAMSWADHLSAEAIVIGANALDYSGYPDCRPRFLQAFEKVAMEGSRRGTEEKKKISILSPLVHLSKADIIRLGKKLNAPLEKTWSCYQGGASPCGKCDSCLLREKGFVEAALR